jgi:hypothetical protein
MKCLALLLVCAACDPSPAELDHPVSPSGTAFSSGWTPGEPGPDAATPGGGGGGDGGFGLDGGLGDAGGLGPDAAVQLDAGIIDFFDASVPPLP